MIFGPKTGRFRRDFLQLKVYFLRSCNVRISFVLAPIDLPFDPTCSLSPVLQCQDLKIQRKHLQ
ncbi:hypothetical protein LINPERPRIM_LOCUS20992 [Linum perenne]